MQVTFASEATPGRENEDFVAAGPGWVVLLDGATAPPGVDSGCRHDPAWLVRRLGGRIAAGLAAADGEPLPDLVAEAIKVTAEAHAGTCDLGNPDSPSATVSMLRRRADAVDWFVLADSPILFETTAEPGRAGAPQDGGRPAGARDAAGAADVAGAAGVLVCRDDRVDRLPSYTPAAVRAARNSPGGFWVASTRPEAAHEARTGRVPLRGLRRAAVLSDGASRLVERFERLSWAGLLRMLDDDGPAEVVRRTREAEAAHPADAARRGKRYDDATAVLVRF